MESYEKDTVPQDEETETGVESREAFGYEQAVTEESGTLSKYANRGVKSKALVSVLALMTLVGCNNTDLEGGKNTNADTKSALKVQDKSKAMSGYGVKLKFDDSGALSDVK